MTNQRKLMEDLARKVTMREPSITVLDESLIDQYLLIVKALDSSFKNKLRERRLLLPELRDNGNESIAIYSDYGGEASDSYYLTYSFLVCGWNHSFAFPEGMTDLRKKYKLKTKEINFKDLRYGQIKRSLSEYLALLDNTVPGSLVSIVVDKRIKSFFGEKIPSYVYEELESRGLDHWKPKETEKVMRIVHVLSYLVALLSKEGQKLYWVTDNDSIAPNQSTHDHLASLFESVLTLYTNNKYPLIGYSTPFADRSLQQIDFLSCADLAAGAVEHYFTRKKKFPDKKVKKEAERILEWLGYDGICLKKHTTIIDQKDDGSIEMGEIVFSSEKRKARTKGVPIPVCYKI